MRDTVEQTRDLVAVHNMTEQNLRGALALGGLPVTEGKWKRHKGYTDSYGENPQVRFLRDVLWTSIGAPDGKRNNKFQSTF